MTKFSDDENACKNVALISLDHVAGNIDGIDIIYSTLLKLIQCATTEITLVFGYFQLFPHLEASLLSAIEREVKVKLFSNSSLTGDIIFL